MTTQRVIKRERRRARRGETFVELLIAVLLVAFASLLVAVLYSAAFQANRDAEEQDDTYYGALSDIEEMGEKRGTVDVTIEGEAGKKAKVKADEYGNGTYYSYRYRKPDTTIPAEPSPEEDNP